MKLCINAAVLFLSAVIFLSACVGENNKTINKNNSSSAEAPVSSEQSSSEDSSDTVSSGGESVKSDITSSATNTASSAAETVKKMTVSQGQDYLLLAPIQNHPGVVGMDATYQFQCTDKMMNFIAASDYTLSASNAAVTVSGDKITVPYAVRSSDEKLTVTATLDDNPIKNGSYTFNFRQFTAQPTFSEEFDTLDTDVWEPTSEDDRMGVVDNGNLVFTVVGENEDRYEMNTKQFRQAYGCFSARIDMPKIGNANAAFWMMTTNGDRYIKNPAMPSQSNGEIDIVEYFPTWGDKWSAALHWFAWNPNYLCSSGDDHLPGKGIRDDYHIFSVVWDEDAIYWYYDSELARVYTGSGVASGSGPMALLLQLKPEYEDGWGGKYDPTQFPYQMKTDWVRTWAFR